MPDGQGIESKIISQYHDQFNWGAICRYKIEFPPRAAEYDRVVLKINSLEFAQVTAVQTLSYTSESYEELKLGVSDAILVHYPYVLYLIVASDFVTSPASFDISYWFEDRDPDALTSEERKDSATGLELEPQVEVVHSGVTKRVVEDKTLMIVLIICAVFILITIVFCIALIMVKR